MRAQVTTVLSSICQIRLIQIFERTQAVGLNKRGIGKSGKFWPLSYGISETLQDRNKIATDWDVAYMLSVGTRINDLR